MTSTRSAAVPWQTTTATYTAGDLGGHRRGGLLLVDRHHAGRQAVVLAGEGTATSPACYRRQHHLRDAVLPFRREHCAGSKRLARTQNGGPVRHLSVNCRQSRTKRAGRKCECAEFSWAQLVGVVRNCGLNPPTPKVDGSNPPPKTKHLVSYPG
jgi:hypothetical protein